MKTEDKKDYGAIKVVAGATAGAATLTIGEMLIKAYNSSKINHDELWNTAAKKVAETLGKSNYTELFNEIVKEPAAKESLDKTGMIFPTEFFGKSEESAWKAVEELLKKTKAELQEKATSLDKYQIAGLIFATAAISYGTGALLNELLKPKTKLENSTVEKDGQLAKENKLISIKG